MSDDFGNAKIPLVRTLKYTETANLPQSDEQGHKSLTGVIDFLRSSLKRLRDGSFESKGKSFVVLGLPDAIEFQVLLTGPAQGNLYHQGSLEESAAAEQKLVGSLESKVEKKAADNGMRLAKRAAKAELTAEEVNVALGQGEVRRLTKSFFNLSRERETIGDSLSGEIKSGGRIQHPNFFPGDGKILFQRCRIADLMPTNSMLLRFDALIHEKPLRARLGDDGTVRCYLALGGAVDREIEPLVHGSIFADVQFDCMVTEMLSTTKRGEWVFGFERFADPVALLKQISIVSESRLRELGKAKL